MKRVFALILALMLLLLCACDRNTVPAYDPPDATPSSQGGTHAGAEPSSDPSTPELSTPSQVSTREKNTQVLRLRRFGFISDTAIYSANNTLNIYDGELDQYKACCRKANCPHVDKNCNAWLDLDINGLRFAVKDNVAYCAFGAMNEYGNLTDLQFFTIDLNTGERRSYYEVPAKAGVEILLGDVLVSGNVAVLNYDTVNENVNKPASTKNHYILAFDLTTGSMTAVMEREIDRWSTYDLWGMNESHIIVAFHSSGGTHSYGTRFGSYVADFDYGYDRYTRDIHRWVLLEYPIEEDALWSEHIAAHEAASSLFLSSYSSFYDGKLYYVSNSYVKVYDLETHTNDVLFYQPGISDLVCADGKIFYQTDAKEYFWYEIDTGTACQYQKEYPAKTFRICEETDDTFLGYYSLYTGYPATTDTLYQISKADFYAENYEAAVPTPIW